MAARLAALQATPRPSIDKVWISVFAADHGVANERVSAFPQAVTAQMVANFARGGAAINVLARQVNARLEVIDVGIVEASPELPGVISARAASGTANFVQGEAMTEGQLSSALQSGRDASKRALGNGSQLFIGGDMGIANTTSASALACALLDDQPQRLVGPGTGLDSEGVAHKRDVVNKALARHPDARHDPLRALRCLGGFEIAALVGAYIHCAQNRLPVVVDGFITTVAALLAMRITPNVHQWFIYAHRSQEPGHDVVLRALDAQPLLNLSMRLGEGSGAALAVPILRAACALHREMATFAEAQISQSHQPP